MKIVNHEFGPFYTENSKILILGSMPSPKSREEGFYYAHPQNKFWKVLSDVLEEEMPMNIEDKKFLLKKYNIALWDVLNSCQIKGASDSTITDAKENDINSLLVKTKIKTIFVTGKTAYKFYNKLCLQNTKIPCIYLPSTSPANCSIKYDELKEKYLIIKKCL